MPADIQTLTLAGKTFVVVEQAEYERLRLAAMNDDEPPMPALPPADENGNFPAIPYARASLARKIIEHRRSLGWSQAELARRAGVRLQTVNRLEGGQHSPSVRAVDKLERALVAASEKATGKKRKN